jgi:predicted permease
MGFFRRIGALGRRSRLSNEIDAELRAHLQMRIDENLANGMSPTEAAREARLRFGNPTVMRERVDAEDTAPRLDSFLRDARYAVRGFAKSRSFTAMAVLTLALGIGANTAVFQIVDAVRLRSLPIQNPQELAELRVAGGNPGFGVGSSPYASFTLPMWQEVRRHHSPFTGIFAWRPSEVLIGRLSDARHAAAIEVSGGFFDVLGVVPWQGRLIEPQDEAGEDCAVSKAVVSYPFWKSEMNGARITPATTLTIDGRTVQVLGVTPPSFLGLAVGDQFDVVVPTCTPKEVHAENFLFTVMGRLKTGWTIERASAYFDALSPGLFHDTAPTGYSSEALKTYLGFRLAAYPAANGVSALRDQYQKSLNLLLAITGLVLLIACANLANLMLARTSARQREIGIRMALGASRRRLLCQLLLESALLAAIGAALGMTLAQPLSRLLLASLNTSENSIQLVIATDWRVLLFATAVAALTCLVFGTVPALRATRVDPLRSLKTGERGVAGSRERFSMQRLMVVSQVSISMVLLVAALLFTRSYRNLMNIDPGIRVHGITIGYFGYWEEKIKPENEAAYKRQLVDEVRAIPGVENAAATTQTPLRGNSWTHAVRVNSTEGDSKFTYVSPSYLATMGIAMVSGRGFTPADTTDTPFVVIVNQTFVRKYLAGKPPIGQIVHVKPEPQYPERTYEIVGTIVDTKYNSLSGETPPMAFVPIDQFPVTAQGPGAGLMIATAGNSASTHATIQAIRNKIAAEHPSMLIQFIDFEQSVHDRLVGDRMMAMLSGFFGLLAALLVAVGLYGVLAYLIAQRRNEIGIRIALGAHRWQVIGLVMRDTALMLLAGAAVGLPLALLAGRSASSILFGLKAYDPATLGFALALLAVIAVLASWLPARSAANLDPVAALRSE